MQAYREVVRQIPGPVGEALRALPAGQAAQTTEIRIRAGKPVVLTQRGKSVVMPACGEVSAGQLWQIFQALCGYSVYAHHQSLSQGYFTLKGGHRVGVAGRAVLQNGKLAELEPITGLNLRIARHACAALPPALQQVLESPMAQGLVLAGAPASGKTTVLRGIVEYFSSLGKRVCAVDERCELGGTVAVHCDVLENCPKAEGLLWAVRSLSPQVLVCDEVGGAADAAAVCAAANAGVRLVVTMHGRCMRQLQHRPQCRMVLATGAFSHIAFLRGEETPGEIGEVASL